MLIAGERSGRWFRWVCGGGDAEAAVIDHGDGDVWGADLPCPLCDLGSPSPPRPGLWKVQITLVVPVSWGKTQTPPMGNGRGDHSLDLSQAASIFCQRSAGSQLIVRFFSFLFFHRRLPVSPGGLDFTSCSGGEFTAGRGRCQLQSWQVRPCLVSKKKNSDTYIKH